MDELLGLPAAERRACMDCASWPYTCSSPAPSLPSSSSRRQGAVGALLHTVDMDTLQAAAALLQQGWGNPAVLNMANEHNCGGGWCQKRGSQEEDLMRCSSLPLSLWPRRRPSDCRMPEFDERLPRAQAIYPLAEAGVVYTPHVVVCRDRSGQCIPRERRYKVSVLSCAAQDLREYKPHYQGPFDPRLTTEKMRSLLWAAAHHGHTALVLGAFGCGAFQHNPAHIADLFEELLGPGGEYERQFDLVLFAVIKSARNLGAFGSVFPPACDVPPRPAVAEVPPLLGSSAPELPELPESEVLLQAPGMRPRRWRAADGECCRSG